MGNNDAVLEIYQLLNSPTKQKTLFEAINERREKLELSNLQLANILNIPKSTWDRTIKSIEEGTLADIDFYLILKLGQFLGMGVDAISQVYVASLSAEKIKQLEDARKANYILSNFDVKALKKAGFIENVTDFNHIEARIKQFFHLDNLFDYTNEVGGVLFSKTKNLSSDKMRELWVRGAIFQFQKMDNPNEYDNAKLLSIIPKIRPYTRYEEKGLLTVLQALFNIGVTVIVQSYLSKTQVRGGTFVVNGKPCIAITDYNKSYATLWFALLHELYHVLYDLEELKTLSYHLTGEEQSDLYLFKEEMADYFACEMLFPQESLNYIKHSIQSPMLVAAYAEKMKVHPSIIYSFYCYEQSKQGKNCYALYNQYFGNPEKALKMVKTNPWNKETIYIEIEKARKILIPTTA